NRFLAAGLIGLGGLGVGFAGAVLAPALARALAAGRAEARDVRVASSAALLVPLVFVVAGGIVLITLARISAHAMTVAPLRYAFWAMLTAALLPVVLAFVEGFWLAVPRWVDPLAAIGYGGAVGAGIAAT